MTSLLRLTVLLVLCIAQAGEGLCADTLTNIPRPAAPAASPPAPTPETAQATTPQSPDPQKAVPQAVRPETAQTPETPAPQSPERAEVPAPAVPGEAPRQLTIVELLPMTPAPEQRKAEKTPAREDLKPDPAQEKKKAAPAKESKAKAPKPKEPAKPRASTKKPAIGEELRIPPEAVSTGNLDFLEGCWQGTRPEYYSKRIIKECFCFGANGGAGKRRVIDSLGGRMCIGSSKAKLSRDGVLSVTSSGAACTDGERWGQAEMVCRGTGQRAPCTWVFKDAQGGRQSYEIPFVRVESCGR